MLSSKDWGQNFAKNYFMLFFAGKLFKNDLGSTIDNNA